MLRKTMIVLATAAALTGGLPLTRLRAAGEVAVGVDTVAVSAVALIWAAVCAILLSLGITGPADAGL